MIDQEMISSSTDDEQVAAPVKKVEPEAVKTVSEEAETDEQNDSEDSADSDGDDAAETRQRQNKGVGKRINELTREKYEERRAREAAEQRLALLEAQLNEKQVQQQPEEDKTLEDFNFDLHAFLEYREKRVESKAKETFLHLQRQQEESQLVQRRQAELQSRIEAAEQESPGIWEKAISAPINYSDAMLEVVTATENGIRVAAWLADNLETADKISRMNPYQAAAALGRIEAEISAPKVSAPVQNKPVTKAPAPVKTVSSASKSARTWSDMSTEDHITAFRERERAKHT